MMVVTKLMAPMIEEMPDRATARIQRNSPLMKWPSGFCKLIGGYDHHPDEAGPPGAKKLPIKTMENTGTSQKAAAFSFGNAMSGAPIIVGINRLLKPLRMGKRNRNNITVPCMV